MMIDAAQHDDADAIFTLELVESFTGLAADFRLAGLERLEASFEGTLVLFSAEAEHRCPHFIHLICTYSAVLKIEDRIKIENIVLREDIALLGEGRLHGFGSCSHRGAGVRTGKVYEMGVQYVIHREPDRVERLFAVLGREQVVNVRNANLRRIAGVDGAAAPTRTIELRRGVVGVEDVLGFEAKTGEITVEERSVGIGVQQAWDANAKICASRH